MPTRKLGLHPIRDLLDAIPYETTGFAISGHQKGQPRPDGTHPDDLENVAKVRRAYNRAASIALPEAPLSSKPGLSPAEQEIAELIAGVPVVRPAKRRSMWRQRMNETNRLAREKTNRQAKAPRWYVD